MSNKVNFKKHSAIALTSLVTFGAANFALAVDDTAVAAAYTAGTTSVGLAVTGLIGLMAVIVGVGAVISLLRKG
jgi:hypothetical protein